MSDLLKHVRYKDFNAWDVKLLFNDNSIFNDNYPNHYFKEFAQKADIKKIKIKDNNLYKILGVRSHGVGVYLNREVSGETLKMRIYQQAKENHLFWCKVDTKNGSFGVIDKIFKNTVASSNMALAELDISKINTNYLQLFFKSKLFNRHLDNFVVGTTNRKYIKFNDLLNNVKIPLPPLEIQQKIVKNYQDKLNLAKQQTEQVQQKEAEIETYLYQELGIELPKEKKQNTDILQFVRFKDLHCWSIEKLFLKSSFDGKYQATNFINICDFKNKRFDKSKYKEKFFSYVDIGSVDSLNDIESNKSMHIQKAPSRATQYINTGDLIIATTRPYLKKFAIVDNEFNNNVCSSGFTVIQQNIGKYNLFYIKGFLQSFYGIEQFKENMTGGLYPAITLAKLKNIQIPLPPLKIQNQIAEHIQNIKNQIQTLKQQAKQNQENALSEFEEEIFNAS